jgi:hypothetical protein
LSIPGEITIFLIVILVGFDMGEYPVEQEATTVCHDVLEDVRMTALGRYPVGGKVFYFF